MRAATTGKTSPIGLLAGLTTAIALAIASGTPARAQGVGASTTAVQQCLCAERAVSILGRDMRTERRRADQARGNADALAREVTEARSRVNTDNRGDIEAFKALLGRRDDAAESYRQEDRRYADAVDRYNRAVERNNAECTGRLFDQEEVEAVKPGLVCAGP
jgi:hypothetical protein